MAPLPLAGGCLCGAVRYRIDAAPASVMICHCATCRRAAGAPSVAWATVPAAGFALTAGAPAEYASSPRRDPDPLRRPAGPASPSGATAATST